MVSFAVHSHYHDCSTLPSADAFVSSSHSDLQVGYLVQCYSYNVIGFPIKFSVVFFSYCNTNDVSWGNRPGGAHHAQSADVAAQVSTVTVPLFALN